MKVRLRLLVLLMVGLAGFIQACSRQLKPQESCNFVQNPELQRVSWKGAVPVKLWVHSSVPTDAYATIDKAVAEYNLKVGGGKELLKVQGRGATGAMEPKRDGYNMLYWFDTWDKNKPTEQARTTIYWSGNEIFEADVRVNAANFRYYFGEDTHFSEVDLTSLLVHEFGHVLGLAHNVTNGSVMNLTLDQGQVRRALGAVDETSLKCEY